jgi:hypothetical protein
MGCFSFVGWELAVGDHSTMRARAGLRRSATCSSRCRGLRWPRRGGLKSPVVGDIRDGGRDLLHLVLVEPVGLVAHPCGQSSAVDPDALIVLDETFWKPRPKDHDGLNPYAVAGPALDVFLEACSGTESAWPDLPVARVGVRVQPTVLVEYSVAQLDGAVEVLGLQQEHARSSDSNVVVVAVPRLDIMEETPAAPRKRPQLLLGSALAVGTVTPPLDVARDLFAQRDPGSRAGTRDNAGKPRQPMPVENEHDKSGQDEWTEDRSAERVDQRAPAAHSLLVPLLRISPPSGSFVPMSMWLYRCAPQPPGPVGGPRGHIDDQRPAPADAHAHAHARICGRAARAGRRGCLA